MYVLDEFHHVERFEKIGVSTGVEHEMLFEGCRILGAARNKYWDVLGFESFFEFPANDEAILVSQFNGNDNEADGGSLGDGQAF